MAEAERSRAGRETARLRRLGQAQTKARAKARAVENRIQRRINMTPRTYRRPSWVTPSAWEAMSLPEQATAFADRRTRIGRPHWTPEHQWRFMTCEERARCHEGNQGTFRQEVWDRIDATNALERNGWSHDEESATSTMSGVDVNSDGDTDAEFIHINVHEPHVYADAAEQPSNNRPVETGPYNESDLAWLSFISSIEALRCFLRDYGDDGAFAGQANPKYRFELR